MAGDLAGHAHHYLPGTETPVGPYMDIGELCKHECTQVMPNSVYTDLFRKSKSKHANMLAKIVSGNPAWMDWLS